MESSAAARGTDTDDRREPAWRQCLRQRARLLEQVPELERRQVALVEGVAARSGVPSSVLNEAYDLALEVGLDPVLALELIGCGVSVLELAPIEPPDQVVSVGAPAWVSPPLEPPDKIELSRRMRLTFRRMRTTLEQSSDLDAAIAKFCAAADVGSFPYGSDE